MKLREKECEVAREELADRFHLAVWLQHQPAITHDTYFNNAMKWVDVNHFGDAFFPIIKGIEGRRKIIYGLLWCHVFGRQTCRY
jgi:hypothetical protein